MSSIVQEIAKSPTSIFVDMNIILLDFLKSVFITPDINKSSKTNLSVKKRKL